MSPTAATGIAIPSVHFKHNQEAPATTPGSPC